MKKSILFFTFIVSFTCFTQCNWVSRFSRIGRTFSTYATQQIRSKCNPGPKIVSQHKNYADKAIYSYFAVASALAGQSYYNVSCCEENISQSEMDCALVDAAQNGNRKNLKKLMHSGANIDAVDEHGFTSLEWAVENDDGLMVSILLDRGAFCDYDKLLSTAAAQGKVQAFEALFRYGYDLKDCHLDKFLILASSGGHLALVTRLLECGADIDGKAFYSNALVEAVRHGHLDTVKYLCANGADPNARDMLSGGTVSALELAYSNGNNNIMRVLLDAGSKPSKRLQKKMNGVKGLSCLVGLNAILFTVFALATGR